jgi:hypothetical protein
MSLLSDLGDLTGSSYLQDFGNTTFGQNISNKVVASVNKAVTPKPAAQPAATATTTTPVSVSVPDQGTMKKVAIVVGSVVLLLFGVYFFKKGRK